jgi:UDP-glucose 4-epimerase
MRVLVTGGSGFIGRHVCEELQERNHEPLIFDHHDKVITNLSFFIGDIRDDVAVTEAFAQVDAFIHLAAVLGTQETIQNPNPAAKTNVIYPASCGTI